MRSRSHARPGLVLLYAPSLATMSPAFAFESDDVVVGREPPPGGIALVENAVSRLHAKFARHARATGDVDEWVVTDLGSKNGVFVRGARVPERPLVHGDEIRIGDALFKFVADEVDAYRALALDAPGVPFADGVGGVVMSRIATELARVAPGDLAVLITGESGSGKELSARALHSASKRRGKLSSLNCAAIPASLVESELFGWKRGAFTGAERDHVGLVRASDGGTLLLDEIGDMPLEAQAKLLRVIETREVVPLGTAAGEKVDVRIVATTHRDLPTLVAENRFRGDLFARLNGYHVGLPPLRERKEDLYRLVVFFAAKNGRPNVAVSVSFMASLCHYAFPYNVRELEAAVRRALTVAGDARLEAEHLPDAIREQRRGLAPGAATSDAPKAPSAPPAARVPSRTPSADELRALLTKHEGNVSAVARDLDKDRVQIHRWMRMYAIAIEEFRKP
jgi:DNA-binding NtrC family response regulator